MSEEIFELENKTHQSSLRDICYVLFRHKWKMIIFFFAVIIIVFISTFNAPEIFRSEAKLLVRLGRENITLDPTVTTGQIINVSQSRDNEVNLELEILKSQELLENVVDTIGPDAFLMREVKKFSVDNLNERTLEQARPEIQPKAQESPNSTELFNFVKPLGDRDRAILTVMKNLKIKAEKNSSIISISFESTNPRLAKKVIDKLINYYLEKHSDVHSTTGSADFFSRQVKAQREKLDLYENELRNFKDESGFSSLEEQRQDILSHIADLEGQIGAAEAELAASQAKVQKLQEKLSSIPEFRVTQETTGLSNQAVDLMRAKLFELKLEEQDLLTKFTEGSEQVQMTRKRVAEAQMQLDKEIEKAGRVEVTKGVNITYTQTQTALATEQTNLVSIQAKIVNLKKQLATTEEGQTALNEADRKIKGLIREIGKYEATYLRYSEKLDQARIDDALDSEKISNIKVVQSATLPTLPIPQRRSLKLMLGFLVGILGGLGLVLFFEYIDNSIRTPAEIEEKLQLPALASIPHARVNRIRPEKRRIKQLMSGDNGVKNTATQWRIPAKISEHYSIFRQELLLKLNGQSKAPYTLAIIGCQHGEGVSTVAANISAMLAQGRGGRVLLIDTNIQRPSAHQIFKTRLQPGLADMPTEDHDYGDIIVSQRFRNLHILAAGMPNGSPPVILQPTRFTQFINSMKMDYRHVVIDMPAIKEARFSARLSSLCDCVVLVVEADRLRWQVLLEAKEQLLKWNANLVGVVLNKRKFPIPGWLYRML